MTEPTASPGQQTSPAEPTGGTMQADDAMAAVGRWVDETRALARRGRVTEVDELLAAITAHAGRPGVRVAIVAASSRSRARLVGELLRLDLLPADPGAEVPVLITTGAADQLEAHEPGGWRALPARSGRAIVGGAARWWDAGDPPVTAYRLQVSRAELIAPGAELIAVPAPSPDSSDEHGSGDPRWAALRSADAAVVVVQATAAMTRTDTMLITGLMSSGLAAERVLIAVSQLDLVEADERGALLAHVRGRALEISPALAVLPADAGDGAWPLADAARDWVIAMADTGARTARAVQLGRQLVGCLDLLTGSAETAGRRAEQEREQRAAESAAAVAALTNDLRDFDVLREDVRGRRNAAMADFLRQREQFAARLTTDLTHQLDNTPNPADWWDNELLYQLQVRLSSLEQQVRHSLQQRVSQSARQLAEDLSSRFGVRPTELADAAVPASAGSVPPELGGERLSSLHRRRLLYRVVPTGMALVAVIAIPGIGPVAGLTATLIGTGLGEIRLRTAADEQREVIRKRLPPLLDSVLNAYGDQVATALEEVYRQHETQVGLLREQWEASVPAPAAPPPGMAPWARLQADCRALTSQIQSWADAQADVAVRPGTTDRKAGI